MSYNDNDPGPQPTTIEKIKTFVHESLPFEMVGLDNWKLALILLHHSKHSTWLSLDIDADLEDSEYIEIRMYCDCDDPLVLSVEARIDDPMFREMLQE